MGKKDNTNAPKSGKLKKEKLGNKGTGILTAVVGVATLGVLALTAITIGKTTAAAQNSANPNDNPTTLELQRKYELEKGEGLLYSREKKAKSCFIVKDSMDN